MLALNPKAVMQCSASELANKPRQLQLEMLRGKNLWREERSKRTHAKDLASGCPRRARQRIARIVFTFGQTKRFTQALLGAIQMMKVLIRKMNLDKEKNVRIADINNVTKGMVASMDQCIDQPRRRKITKKENIRFEEAGRTTITQAVSRAVKEGREERNEGTMDD
jgi:hypothetical protein